MISAARASSVIAPCSGVGGSLTSATNRPRRPISVSFPTANDDALAGAADHRRTRVQHAGPLGERRVGVHRLGALGGRHRLAGQPGLVGGQAVGLGDAGVGRDDAAGLHQQHVADDQRADRDLLRNAGAADERIRGAELAQRLQRAFGADLGDRLHRADEHDHGEDRDRVAKLAEDRRQYADDDQQQLQRLQHGLGDLSQRGGSAAASGLNRVRAALRDLLGLKPARAAGDTLPYDRQRLCLDRNRRRTGVA